MKKIFYAIFSILLVMCFAACGENRTSDKTTEDTYNIVCTMFPQYDWIKNMTEGENNINVTLLCTDGTDIHSYQASAEDILKIKSCDLLVGTDKITDLFAYEAAYGVPGVKTVSLTELAGVSHSQEEHHLHGEECEQEHTHSALSDEHIWMSPAKAAVVAKKLGKIIADDNPESTSLKEKIKEYAQKLEALDRNYRKVCENSPLKQIVVADRFPFAHLAADYNLECFAAFPGCSADTDTSFETVIYLASKADEYSLEYVAVTENPDPETANAVISITSLKNQQILTINSLQSVNARQLEKGISYISVMEENLDTLKKLLDYKGE